MKATSYYFTLKDVNLPAHVQLDGGAMCVELDDDQVLHLDEHQNLCEREQS
eukprot:CAMPEP_0185773582 /NCGR_PEP_ID=MMETSP1174-20130828/74219_1 /TAXON_ID=35687 /ORGANISM="Dictyocha speculum, Strain CCMP1381" /LENGTH=50 /DNA_ID=CAMNT_0028460339 /DNA_START=154 /DNA_END=302 /DNA_ORIENTATION=+